MSLSTEEKQLYAVVGNILGYMGRMLCIGNYVV